MIFVTSIVLLEIIISPTFLNAEPNYKPKLERNNVVNKGVWVKEKFSEDNQKSVGDFIFKSLSMDTDDLLDNDFYTFGASFVENPPFVSNYIDRAKRSPNVQEKQRLRKSIKKCGTDKDCILDNMIEDETLAKSKLIAKIKPTSVFNDYPYEVAVLLRNAYSNVIPSEIKKMSENIEKQKIPSNEFNKTHVNIEMLVDDGIISNTSNDSKNISLPKRSMNFQNSNILTPSETVGDYNGTETKKVDRNILNDDRIWHEGAPLPDSDAYKLIPKIERPKIKHINERGLIKVIVMLSKAFKKIMKQHADIKKIHDKLYTIKDEVDSSVSILFTKFQEFDRQYVYLTNITEKVNLIESRLNAKDEYITKKENELAKSLIEFENQQKKFLSQQREFYNVQKLMLAQNEKINTKQIFIAKTQSEISHRQYNFARILKKAKEIYIDSQPLKFTVKGDTPQKVTHTTTNAPITTDSIKINLFSIPPTTRLENQDKLILKEIDEQPVDDIIYKYYFNNTFIDNIMKNKILAGFVSHNENNQIVRNVKKRDENPSVIKTTILLPINNSVDNVVENKIRERRWIRHSKKLKRKHRGKSETTTNVIDDEKKGNHKTSVPENVGNGNVKYAVASTVTNIIDTKQEQVKSNPFLTMAINFCNQIQQNGNTQVLNWCIEKALRRLQNIDIKIPILPPNSILPASEYTSTNKLGVITSAAESTTTDPNSKPVKVSLVPNLNLPISPTTSLPTTTPSAPVVETTIGFFPDGSLKATLSQTSRRGTLLTWRTKVTAIFVTFIKFVTKLIKLYYSFLIDDNDELESNLKQYELVKDKEGVFYYDSVHASDEHDNSGGMSDIMLGMDSNSRIDVDPMTFDLHAKRRASVQRINDIILKKFKLG